MTAEQYESRLIRIRAMCDATLGDYHAVNTGTPTPRERALLRRQVAAIEAAITDLEMESGAYVYFTKTAQNKLELAPVPRIDLQTSLIHFPKPKTQGEN